MQHSMLHLMVLTTAGMEHHRSQVLGFLRKLIQV
jgi:hypothetical protein